MKDFLLLFYAAADINERWLICQQYQGNTWSAGKIGISASCESDKGQFWITDMDLVGFGIVQVASREIPTSNAVSITTITFEPPRTFEDLQNCGCPLFCY